jgi:hypothetical protein
MEFDSKSRDELYRVDHHSSRDANTLGGYLAGGSSEYETHQAACQTDYFQKHRQPPSLPELLLDFGGVGSKKAGPRTELSLDATTGREAVDTYDAQGRHSHKVMPEIRAGEERE